MRTKTATAPPRRQTRHGHLAYYASRACLQLLATGSPVPRFGRGRQVAIRLLLAGASAWHATPPANCQDALARATVEFVDVTRESGIDFVHENAATADKYLIETMGGGAAWLDYDGDRNLDLYLANSAATDKFDPPSPLVGALYRAIGDGKFEVAGPGTGVGLEHLFAMGLAAGDFDNDGDTDLAVSGYGRSVLLRNEGDGTFRDVTERPVHPIKASGGRAQRGSITTLTGCSTSRSPITWIGPPKGTCIAASDGPDTAPTATPTSTEGRRRRSIGTWGMDSSRIRRSLRALRHTPAVLNLGNYISECRQRHVRRELL